MEWGDDMKKLSENALITLRERYLAKDEHGEVVETPEQMFLRVATDIAKVEKKGKQKYWREMFFEMMTELEFLPSSPILMNAGRHFQMLSACFVLPIPDDMEGIFDAKKQMMMIQKAGGGTGLA